MRSPFSILSPTMKGAAMLAPRGVSFRGDVLAVSDTGQNRVLLWKNGNYLESSAPDVVLGQQDYHHTGRNTGEGVGASSLQYPSGIWTDGQRLIVADAWNHRVLIWHTMPSRHGQPADVVLGQRDFSSNQPNVGGLAATPSARSLYWPYGVCSDGKALWVADTGNRRVLYFESIPTANFTAATRVVGQPNFEERGYDNSHAIWPYAVKIGPDNELAIADTQYFRVLLWKDWTEAFTQQANVVVGQKDFSSNGQNQYRSTPEADTLNWCYDCCFNEKGLFVADTGNSRILHWHNMPGVHGVPADGLLGQEHFRVIGESSLRMDVKLENELYWPFSLDMQGDLLAVADTGNHRILFYHLN